MALGYKHTEETKKKMSLLRTGKKFKPFTEEHKEKLRQSNLGQKRSDEAKENMSKASKGIPRPYRKGIPVSEETKKKISDTLKKNPVRYWLGKKKYEDITKCNFWQGGKSFETYSVDWKKSLKISIRERDHYQCQMCGERQDDEALSVHHIDYNKKNCDPNNLISLCRICHSKTNHNREYWIEYFKQYGKENKPISQRDYR